MAVAKSPLMKTLPIATRSLSFVAFVLGAVLATACSGDDPVNELENRITCGDVCERYSECFDASYDVEECTDRCTEDATDDDEKDEKLEACDACMEEKSCVSAVFSCTDDCASFVP